MASLSLNRPFAPDIELQNPGPGATLLVKGQAEPETGASGSAGGLERPRDLTANLPLWIFSGEKADGSVSGLP